MRQATARDLAQRVTKKHCQCKMLRAGFMKSGPKTICAIFVDNATNTKYHGLTWDEALEKLFIAYVVSDDVRETLGIPRTGSGPGKPAVVEPVALQPAS